MSEKSSPHHQLPIFIALLFVLILNLFLNIPALPTLQATNPLDTNTSTPQPFITPTTNNSVISDTTSATSNNREINHLPVMFEANQGQAFLDSSVKFFAHGHNYNLFLTSDEAIFSFNASFSSKSTPQAVKKQIASSSDSTANAQHLTLKMKLNGANPSVQPESGQPFSGKVNYFIGDKENWKTGLNAYKSVEYKAIYPGVDLAYYGEQTSLNYAFTLAPGANAGSISLTFEGADNAVISGDKGLLLTLGEQKLEQSAPLVYQVSSDGERQIVSGGFIDKGNKQLGLQVGDYDQTRPLVIVPTIVRPQNLGGSGTDASFAIAVDKLGNSYITGQTDSPNFPPNHPSASVTDVLLVKLNPAGTDFLVATYIGGSGADYGYGIAVDNNSNIYVTGSTSSSDYLTTSGAYQTQIQSNSGQGGDAFVTKFNPTADKLIYSTYLGGSGGDGAFGIAVGSDGSAYVTGSTFSPTFPTNVASCNGQDAFLTRLNPLGTSILYSACFNSGISTGNGITLDDQGNAYATGSSSNSIFVTKYSTSGTQQFARVYTSSTTGDGGNAIDVDKIGNIYVTGQITNPAFITTVDAFQPTLSGASSSDAFLLRLNTNADVTYSTFLGGSGGDVGVGVKVDADGIVYITGQTSSSDFPTTSEEACQFKGGGEDIFITKLNPGAGRDAALSYSVLIGGSANDYATGIALDPDNSAYVTGYTTSTDFPNPDGSTGPSFGGLDIFVYKLPSNKPTSDVPNFSFKQADDLYTPADSTKIITTTGPALNFNLGISRYYGLVNKASHKLIDVDPSDGSSSAEKATNAQVHDTNATLYLWMKPGTALPSQSLQFNITGGPNNTTTSVNVTLPAVPAAGTLITLTVAVGNLYFPDICVGAKTTRPCLRNPNVKNYDTTQPDAEGTFTSITPEINKISITGWSSGAAVGRISCAPYMFLNGVRPVLLMAGIAFPGPRGIADTTVNWGGVTPSAEQPQVPDGVDARWDLNNYIVWLSNAYIPNWNPARDGTRSVDGQQIFLRQGSQFLQRVYGAKKINIIAHSMGGVTSRRFTYNTNVSGIEKVVTVDKLITLNSPHTGVRIAGVAGFLPFDPFGGAAKDNSTSAMETFSRNNLLGSAWFGDDPRTHQYYINTHAQQRVNGVVQYITNDGLIEDDSATGRRYLSRRSSDEFLPGNYATQYLPDVCAHVIKVAPFGLEFLQSFICHRWVPHSPQVANWITSTQMILNYGRNQVITTGSAASNQNNPPPRSVSPSDVAANNPLQTLLSITGTIGTNQTVSVPLILDNVSNPAVSVGLDNDGPVQGRLETAAGAVVAANQTVPNVFAFTGTSLAPGNYRLILSAGTLTQPITYSVGVIAQSDLAISTIITPSTAGAANPGKVEVTLNNGAANTQVTGATVTSTLTIFAVSGLTTTANITLTDNGSGGDVTANDGKYTAFLPSGLISETVFADVYAQGTWAGNAFTRRDGAVAKTRTGQLTFTGSYNWQTVSNLVTGATANIDKINLDVGANVQQAGTYQLAASLAAADGTVVSTMANQVTLGTGSKTLRITFNGLQLGRQPHPGPYHLVALSASIVLPDDIYVTDQLDDTSNLPQLNVTRDQFTRPPFLRSAAITDAGINPDSNGKFQALAVTVTLDVATTGSYSYSAYLRSPTGALVVSTQGSANLTAGSATPLQLTFDGGAIFASGQNGPYRLLDLVIKTPANNIVLYYENQVGQTNSYSYTQFGVGCATPPTTVSNATDDGTGGCGTLSKALRSAQTATQPVTITFSTNVISLTGTMPVISNSNGVTVTVEGGCNTTSGTGVPGVRLVAGSGAAANGLSLNSKILIDGLAVTGFSGYAVDILGAGNVVSCNWLGTADGINAAPNGGGIQLGRIGGSSADNNFIGLPDQAASGNLISGNTGTAIQVNNGANNEAHFNWINYQKDGQTLLSNGGPAINIEVGGQLYFSQDNRVGY